MIVVPNHSRPRRAAQGRPQPRSTASCRRRPDSRGARRAQGRPRAGGNGEAGVSAGFAWRVIEAKWPGFEEAFLGLEVPPASRSSRTSSGTELTKDARIVRNGAKILSVRANAEFVRDVAKERGRLAPSWPGKWPSSDEVGLLELLAKRGDRLGGNSGQMLLRFLGWDEFVTSKDVVACLRDAGLDVGEEVKSKRDLRLVQEQFNAWAKETGLPYSHLSRICAFSIGENYQAQELARRGGHEVRYE